MSGQPVFELLTPERLQALRILNSALFPVKFHDQVYKDALVCGDVTQLAYMDGTLVGAIMCRLEAQKSGEARLYIVSLGVLAPYRSLGIGSWLLERSLAACSGDPNVPEAALHVHAGDEEAQGWYLKRGFSIKERIPHYYKRLEPPDALLLTRRISQDHGVQAGDGPAAEAAGGGTVAAGGAMSAEELSVS